MFALCQRPLTRLFCHAGSLADNALCGVKHGRGTYTSEGITKLCEVLKGSAVTSLRCAAAPECSCFLSAPIDAHSMCASPLGSVDGHALQIDELKGTKPTERIDLSYKGLGVASAIIIASCIKENGVLKELRCAAARVFAFVSAPVDTPTFPLAVWPTTSSAA